MILCLCANSQWKYFLTVQMTDFKFDYEKPGAV